MFPIVSNEALRADLLPPPDATWDEIGKFALSFDGYEACGGIHDAAVIANARRGDTLTNLRVAAP